MPSRLARVIRDCGVVVLLTLVTLIYSYIYPAVVALLASVGMSLILDVLHVQVSLGARVLFGMLVFLGLLVLMRRLEDGFTEVEKPTASPLPTAVSGRRRRVAKDLRDVAEAMFAIFMLIVVPGGVIVGGMIGTYLAARHLNFTLPSGRWMVLLLIVLCVALWSCVVFLERRGRVTKRVGRAVERLILGHAIEPPDRNDE